MIDKLFEFIVGEAESTGDVLDALADLLCDDLNDEVTRGKESMKNEAIAKKKEKRNSEAKAQKAAVDLKPIKQPKSLPGQMPLFPDVPIR
jgi:hypothetical protein